MSEINPDFSFPNLPPPNANPNTLSTSLPPMGSPVSKGRRHAHRRSAAMSEDLSALELAAITNPQPTPQAASLAPPAQLQSSAFANTPLSSPQLAPPSPSYRNSASSSRSAHYSHNSAASLSSLGSKNASNSSMNLQPTASVSSASSFSKSSSRSANTPSSSRGGAPAMNIPNSFSQFHSPINSPAASKKFAGEPGQIVFGSPTTSDSSSKSEGLAPPSLSAVSSSTDVYTPESTSRRSEKADKTVHRNVEPTSHAETAKSTDSAGKTDKKKKRRSFVQLFRKSSTSKHDDEHSSTTAKHSHHKSSSMSTPPSHEEIASSLRDTSAIQSSSTLGSAASHHSERNFTPPPTDLKDGDATFTPDDTLVPDTTATHTPVLQQVPQFCASPISTPRSSGEISREPEKPTIDLNEALLASFGHRKQDSVLESPFSKAPSVMNAVLEEEDEEEDDGRDDDDESIRGRRSLENDSESDSLSSGYRSHRPRQSFLQKTASVHSNASWKNSPHSPRPSSILNNGPRSISYVGPCSPKPVLTPPSPFENFSKPAQSSPRVSIVTPEQVSNLAILEQRAAAGSPSPPSASSAPSAPSAPLSTSLGQTSTPRTGIPTSAAPKPAPSLREQDVPPMPTPVKANVKHHSTPPPTKSPKRGHTRRRSLIDKILGRD